MQNLKFDFLTFFPPRHTVPSLDPLTLEKSNHNSSCRPVSPLFPVNFEEFYPKIWHPIRFLVPMAHSLVGSPSVVVRILWRCSKTEGVCRRRSYCTGRECQWPVHPGRTFYRIPVGFSLSHERTFRSVIRPSNSYCNWYCNKQFTHGFWVRTIMEQLELYISW
jgi:hypothetical protein